MALADLLGAVGGGAPVALPDYMGGIKDAVFNNAMSPQARAPAQPHGPSKFRNFLGAIGDALLVSHGQQPMYRQRMDQQRQQSALQGFLTNPDAAIQQLMQTDAKSGIELYRAVHPASETPDTAKLYEYRQKLPPEQRADFDKVTSMLHPGMLAPISLGPNDTYDPGTGAGASAPSLPHVSDQATYDAVAPGAQYTTPDGHIRTKGGQTAHPSGGFPVSKVMDALTAQESGGDGMAVSPKGAIGSTQLLPATAKQMAGKLGLAFVPGMLRSNDPKALKYQRALAEAYFNEGMAKTGNLTDALHYYHGGPDRAQWGPKTQAYASSILARLGPAPTVPGNIDIHNRPIAHNADGSISTVRTISIGTDQGEVLIPTVIGGQVVSNDDAIRHYRQTGEHLGIFRSPGEATTFAKLLHREQAREYGGSR